MPDLSVNEAIERVVELNGQFITVVGFLSLEFEGQSINHIPSSENLDNRFSAIRSSIWVNFDLEAIGKGEEWLQQFDGRHVRVCGKLSAPDPRYGGCGHFSMWPAELIVTAIEKKKQE